MNHTTDKPSSKHDLEQFKQTHQIETSFIDGFGWTANHTPTHHSVVMDKTERMAVIRLCKSLDMLEFPV